MKEFVLIWCQNGNSNKKTLFVLKDRPVWQAGCLNLPGGKVELGETPQQTARRELMEETGYEALVEPRIMGKLVDGDFVIWILKTVVFSDKDPQARLGETEIPQWIDWSEACKNNRLIPNLRIIIPLCMAGG